MAKLTLPQINRELNFLEENYNRLCIKTIEYRVEKKKLLDMKKEIENMSDKQLVKLESQKKPLKRSTLKDKFTKRGGNGIQDEGLVMVGEDTDEYVRPE